MFGDTRAGHDLILRDSQIAPVPLSPSFTFMQEGRLLLTHSTSSPFWMKGGLILPYSREYV